MWRWAWVWFAVTLIAAAMSVPQLPSNDRDLLMDDSFDDWGEGGEASE